MNRCDAHHDGHDCATPGACRTALLALCDRIANRPPDHPDHDRRAIRDQLEAVPA